MTTAQLLERARQLTDLLKTTPENTTKTTKPPCATETQLQTLAEAGDLTTLESLKKALGERVAMTAQERAAMAELKGRK